jgi:DNA-binding MarR family transcriptional regulator
MGRKPAQPAAPGTVAGDLKQKRPFPTKSEEATVGLLLTADVVRRWGEALLKPFGITLQQYNVLRILRGSRPDSLPTLEIAARMIEKAPGVTRLLDRLEKKGLVHRDRCAEDRRQVLCRITEKGLALLETLEGPVRRSEERFKRMSQKDLERLIGLLNAVRQAHR